MSLKKKIDEIITKLLSKGQNKRPLINLFLTGVKGQLQKMNYPKPYNYYITLGSILATFIFARWLVQWKKTQFQRKGYNVLIPQYVYNVREQSYIHWQIVRVAQNLPTTFTYYKWDENLMYQIDRTGKQTPFHTHRHLQDNRTFSSPLHQYIFPANPQNHSKILQYLKNLNNPYDLFNYLRQKPINMGDWLRAGYYLIYRGIGLTNRWRYDQYVSKPGIYYRWEKLKLAFRLSRDRKQLYQALDKIQITGSDIITFLVWFL